MADIIVPFIVPCVPLYVLGLFISVMFSQDLDITDRRLRLLYLLPVINLGTAAVLLGITAYRYLKEGT